MLKALLRAACDCLRKLGLALHDCRGRKPVDKPKFDPKEKFSKRAFGGRARRNPPHIVVRLTRELEPYDDGERYEQERLKSWNELAALWKKVLARSPNARLRPLFRSLSPVELKRLVASARCCSHGDKYPPAPFFAYFQIVGGQRAELLGILAELRADRKVVARAYIEQVGLPPGVNAGGNEPGLVYQFYLKPAPSPADWLGGIDAVYAWAANGGMGGDGARVRIIDVERGWFHDHPDFPLPRPALLAGQNVRPSAEHGTAVLGILCAQDRDDGQGGIGVVPHVTSIDCVSYVDTLDAQCEAAVSNPAAAIAFAASRLAAGDVMLIEATLYEPDLDQPGPGPVNPDLMFPIEANEGNRAAINLAVTLGISVVEAGGNGTDPRDGTGCGDPPLDMNAWPQLDPADPGYADCSAIMVSAAVVSSAGPPMQLSWAPRGRRIDCFAHGQGVYTTTCIPPSNVLDCSTAGYTGDYSPPAFGGTSAATAIVAGAAAAIQGLALAKFGAPLLPYQVRAMLGDPNVNTPVYDEWGNGTVVGVMPDLRRILNGYLGL
jgi:serine protease